MNAQVRKVGFRGLSVKLKALFAEYTALLVERQAFWADILVACRRHS